MIPLSSTNPARRTALHPTPQAAKVKAQQDRALKEKQRLKRQAKKDAATAAAGGDDAFGALTSPSRKRGRSMAGLMGSGGEQQLQEGAGAHFFILFAVLCPQGRTYRYHP